VHRQKFWKNDRLHNLLVHQILWAILKRKTMRRAFFLSLLLIYTIIGTACQPQAPLTNTVTPGSTEEPPATLSAIAQTTSEVTLSASVEREFVIWLPDQLFPVENSDAVAIFESQIQNFAETESDVRITLRRKAVQDVGGILSTLRSASGVAPGALPELTLLRYDDFLAAEQANLLFPFEGLATASVIAELDETAIQLATIDGQLYGVPYVIDVLMAAHTDESLAEQSISFEEILENQLQFTSPLNRSGGISEVFWLQYLAAGGTPLEAESPTINQQALLQVLTFYEDLFQAGLIHEAILDYVTIADYLPELIDGSVDFGIVNSTQFNQLASEGANLYSGTIPTEDGTIISQMNGWIWVVTTGDSQQQATAGRLVNWLLDVDLQGEYTQALGVIPSRSDALEAYPPEGLSLDFIDSLLERAQTPIPSAATGNALRAMQTALLSVVRGEVSAREAAQRAVDQLSG
jgi:ABC-type glycerol-3-phosphate transport system substrate-binding protein